jgi:methylmalonyl-CoA mutase N-terminal domain/subunit
MPRWNTISISGYHIREAGSTAVQELAFTLADGYAYADWAIERGLNVDEFAPRFSFFFNAHNDFFEEIAKYRAARRIWAKDMRYKYGAKDPRSWTLRFHTQTAGCSLTAQQPEINIVRVAIQAMAGVMGGTQSLHTDSMDEALALPSEKAVQIALRTQQVIAHESGVANVVDPLGGSYYLEWLTDDMERQARDYFDRIDSLGGVVPAIEKGFFQKEIAAASYKYQKEIDNKERVVVGVNEYTSDESVEIPILEMDPEGFDRQCARLKKLRASRDKGKFEASIRAIEKAAEGDDNLMPHFIEAAKAKATLGEMCDVLRGVFGEYREGSDF